MAAQTITVPDIGDFSDVPVIEVLVKAGDTIKKNDSLVVLESDKASMEVPSDADGVVKDVQVKVGDKVSKGSVLLTVESAAAANGQAAGHGEASGRHPELVEGHPEASKGSAKTESASIPQRPSIPQDDTVIELKVPDIGDFTDVPVIEVSIKAGDTIKKEDTLVVLESEKASMEVPASAGGVVQDVRVKVGDKVSKGSVIATVAGHAEASKHPEVPKGDAKAEIAVEVIPKDDKALRPRDARSASDAAQGDTGTGTHHASPSIRRFARELGVDLHRVTATGPNKRITRDDVQNFVKSALKSGPSGTSANGAALGLAPWPKVDFAQYGPIERKPMSRIQKLSGPNLHRNWVMIPHVTQNDDADVTDLEAFRKEINAEMQASGVKVTMLSFLVRACIAALKKYPIFNSSLDGDDIVYKSYYNIGFAADTPNGLVVPVIRDADKKSLTDVARESQALAAKARDGKLMLGDMQGGTFTISSLGSIGGTYFTPIINAPEVAILGACKAAIRPVWDGKAFQPRLMQPLSLSYDHRVIDGAAAARFTSYVAEVLADLRRALV